MREIPFISHARGALAIRSPHKSKANSKGFIGGQCGFPDIHDSALSSGPLSEGNSYYDGEQGPWSRRVDLEDADSGMDFFSETSSRSRITTNRNIIDLNRRGRARPLSEASDVFYSSDDEDSSSLDDFVVRDVEGRLRSNEEPSRSLPPRLDSDDWLSSRAASSHMDSPSTRYDTEDVTGIDDQSSVATYPSDDGSPNESLLSQIDVSRGPIRRTQLSGNRTGQGQARRLGMRANRRQNRSHQDIGSPIRRNIQEESQNESDAIPIVRARRRAHAQRLSSSSDSDSMDPRSNIFQGPSLSRINRPRHNSNNSGRSISPVYPDPVRNERGSGSSNGTPRGVPIEIASDSDPPIPLHRSRRRRVTSQDFFSDSQVSTAAAMGGRTHASQSSSGTATIGRQSPALDTAMTSNLPRPSPRGHANSPILIEARPTRTQETRFDPPANRRSESFGSPNEAPSVYVSSPAYTENTPHPNAHISIPPRSSPRPRPGTRRNPPSATHQPSGSPSRSPRLTANLNHRTIRQNSIGEILSSAERRHQQASDNAAIRRSARKAKQKQLKRERRQRDRRAELSVDSPSNEAMAAAAYHRRW